MQTRLKIGTRGSRLALAQAEETKRRLCDAHGFDPTEIEKAKVVLTILDGRVVYEDLRK